MYWKKTDKPCNRVIIKGSKVFECSPGWEVTEVYYNELNPDIDSIKVRFTKTHGPIKYPCHDCEHMETCEWSFTDYMYTCGGKEMTKKYVIELEDKVSENAKGEKLYFVKGFNNLSLDETALKKLTPYSESEHEFKVGDVVEYKKDYECAKIGIITKLTPNSVSILLADGEVRNPSWHYKDDTYTLKYIKSMPSSLHSLINLMTWKNEDLV